MLVPLHAWPAEHSVQPVRVVAVPPDVNEPRGHERQRGALFSLHVLSAPHSIQSPPSSGRYSPARQEVHCVAPAFEAVPGGQGKHVDAPGCGEYVPAAHLAWLLVPSH